jgi:hypothetical protein
MPAKNMASRSKTVIVVNTTSDVPLIMGMPWACSLGVVGARRRLVRPRLIFASEARRDIPQMGDLSLAQIG